MNARVMNSLTGVLFLVSIFAFSLHAGNAGAALLSVNLTEDGQGFKGNVGEVFRPTDEFGNPAVFLLTARSIIDPTAPLDPDAVSSDTGPGTVYIAKDGAGVQNNAGKGSKEISGGGGNQNEELIFSFDGPISLNAIILGLAKVNLEKDGTGFKKSDPILFLSAAANPGVFEYTVTEGQIAAHFVETEKDKGYIALGDLNSVIPDGLIIDTFKIRETEGHTLVALVTIPEPATLGVLLLGALAMLGHRLRKVRVA